MNTIKNVFKNLTSYFSILSVAMFAAIAFADSASAASIPTLTLTSNATSIGIGVTGADPNATVSFYFPNASIAANTASGITYTSIDIGQTDSRGSFNVSVAPNSYSLNGGSSVYVSVDGANSSQTVWPTNSANSGQSGSLSLSQQNVALVNGQSVNIFQLNTSNTLTVQGNSNPSIASAYFQSNNNSVIVTGLNTGSTVISICAGSAGCSSVNVAVTAPTQAVTFSLPTAYVVVGQQPQTISLYGGSGYSLSNTNKDIVSASLSGTNLVLQGLTVGQVTVSVCATGLLCGSLTVNSLASGSAVPNQVAQPPSQNPNFNQPPQLSNLSISSNDVLGLFFGAKSTISINFSINQTVSNVQVKIAGQQISVGQGNNGMYSASYMMTGNEILPLPAAISYTNPSGLVGQTFFWIGNSSTASPAFAAANSTTVNTTPSSAFSSYTFNNYLYMGMTAQGVSNPDVIALQNRLVKDGYFTSSATGYFGPVTKAAVEAYQTDHGLSALGVVGPATRSLLNQGI